MKKKWVDYKYTPLIRGQTKETERYLNDLALFGISSNHPTQNVFIGKINLIIILFTNTN